MRLAALSDFQDYVESAGCTEIFYKLDGNRLTAFAGRCCFVGALDEKEVGYAKDWLFNRSARNVVEGIESAEEIFT